MNRILGTCMVGLFNADLSAQKIPSFEKRFKSCKHTTLDTTMNELTISVGRNANCGNGRPTRQGRVTGSGDLVSCR